MSEEIERIKRKRSVVRSLTTKLINKVEAYITDENFDLELERENGELLESLDQLVEKAKELKKLDNQIENFIELDDFESEITTSEEYQEKIVVWKGRILRKLNYSKQVDTSKLEKTHSILNVESSFKEQPENTLGTQNLSNLSTSVDRNNDLNTVRLPKLSIEKYFGDSSKWLEFWQQFDSAIHSNNSLSKVQKFLYLKSLLSGIALNTVSGFSLTSQNYDSAVKLLESRYGHKDIVINSLMCKLLNVEPVKFSNDIKALRRLYDTCEIQIRSLESMNVTSGMYGHLLYPILLKLIPADIALEFSRRRTDKEEFDIMELIRFLKNEIECRESTIMLNNLKGEKSHFAPPHVNRRGVGAPRMQTSTSVRPNPVRTHELLAPVVDGRCIFCNEQHISDLCESISINEKKDILKKQGRCYLCLQSRHRIKNCKKQELCSICKGKHNRSICFQLQKKMNDNNEDKIVSSVSHCEIGTKANKGNILLQTCSVTIRTANKLEPIRILLDTGSMRTFVTQDISKELRLPVIRKETLSVYAFGAKQPIQKTFNVVKIKLENRNDPSLHIEIEALETEQISAAHLPAPDVNISKTNKCLKGLQLADCYKYNQDKIVILVGADYYYRIVSGRIKRLNDNLVATETIFGWCLQGQRSCSNEMLSMKVIVEENLISEQIKQFWELENLGVESETTIYEPLNDEVMKDFEANITYENKRYTVKFPWKSDMKHLLNDNRDIANRRFLRLKARFQTDQFLFTEYKAVLDSYLCENIIEPVPVECEATSKETIFYLPHRAVIRDDKTTSKLRIVFDASSHEKGEVSLNDCLHTGLNLNPDIFILLIRFRENPIAMTADVKQAFLQIQIHEKDRDVTRFLWDDDSSCKGGCNKLKTFRMTRVLFGVKSSPFLLAATVKHHLKKYVEKFPETSKLLNESLYVDDFIGGQQSIEQALKTSLESIEIFEDASMLLRKWQTNSKELHELWKNMGIDSEDAVGPTCQAILPLKVLGVSWNPDEDIFYFNTESLVKFLLERIDNKHFLLQAAGRIFDHVGFIGPFTIRIKCLIQDIWCLGLDWDEELPKYLSIKWNKWCDEVKELNNVCVPRYYFMDIPQDAIKLVEMHCFSDASKRAYGAVIYLRIVLKNGNFRTSFVASKSRVAPLKTISLPRLELMGALLSARLSKRIAESLQFELTCHFWTDSSITYFWIRGSPDRFKPFVKNRVQEIQRLTLPSSWSHCPGKDNPADLLSRGLTVTELKDNPSWWNGPSWLSESENLWPKDLHIKEQFDAN